MSSIAHKIMELEELLEMVGGPQARILKIEVSPRAWETITFQMNPNHFRFNGFHTIEIEGIPIIPVSE